MENQWMIVYLFCVFCGIVFIVTLAAQTIVNVAIHFYLRRKNKEMQARRLQDGE